jgi:defect-in-organelle-trafficking protein DotD
MKEKLLATVVASFMLAGCQQPKSVITAPYVPPEKTSQNVSIVRAQQYQLWDEKVINTRTPLPADTIYANSTRLSLDWDGDAIELLAQLARQRGLQFNYSGVHLPLPLNIHVRDMTFQNLLRIVESQISWRATLHQYPGLLRVEFMPVKAPPGAADETFRYRAVLFVCRRICDGRRQRTVNTTGYGTLSGHQQ